MLITDIISGITSGLIYGLISAVFIVSLAMIFRYFTKERFPWLISIILGLGIVGISGGLLALVDEPNPISVTRIIVTSLILVWVTNEGDKLATRLPKTRKIPFLSSWIESGRQNYLMVNLPAERDIRDIIGRPRVSSVVKKKLEGSEFVFPKDIPIEDLIGRLRRRLITDWGLGDVEIELDQQGRVTYFAIGAIAKGLSEVLKEGFVAFPIKYQDIPNGLTPRDLVQIYSGNELLLNSVEIKGVDEDTKILTLILAAQDLPKCLGKEITQIIALPRTKETLLVEDLMTRQVYTVGPEASIRAAISLMNRYRVSSVVVMENDKPIGILTDRSFLQQIGKNRLVDLRLTKVRTLMSTPLVEISPEASVDDALTVMRNKHIKKLPVTSKGKLVGIITSNDILRLRH